jgi:hypothetical protein
VPPLPGLRRRWRRSTATGPQGTARKSPPRPRPRSYYEVAGVALDDEMQRLRGLPVFADGPLARSAPQLKVRRASKRPNRLGFAVPSEFRLSVTAYPGIRRGDVLETLLHELVHLHVGRAAEAHAWHGPTFRRTLAQAMQEAYAITIPVPRSTLHGTYAEAIERETAKTPLEEGFLRSR